MTKGLRPGSARRSIADAVEGNSPKGLSHRQWGELGVMSAISGSVFLWLAIALRSLSPGVVALGRVGLGALTLVLVPAARSRIPREDFARFAFASLLGFAIPVLLLALAEERIPSAVAGMMTSSLPTATAVVAAIVTRAWPQRGRLTGEAIGVLFVLGSNVSLAVATTLIAPLQQTYGSLRATLWLFIVATAFLTPFGLLSLSRSSFDLPSLAALAFLGVIGTGVAWVLFVDLVGRVGAVRAGVAGYLIPIVALA